jgi:hypothetical protein
VGAGLASIVNPWTIDIDSGTSVQTTKILAMHPDSIRHRAPGLF